VNASSFEEGRNATTQRATADGTAKFFLELQERQAIRVSQQRVLYALELCGRDSLGHNLAVHLARFIFIWQDNIYLIVFIRFRYGKKLHIWPPAMATSPYVLIPSSRMGRREARRP
jgi:hypothetical protein